VVLQEVVPGGDAGVELAALLQAPQQGAVVRGDVDGELAVAQILERNVVARVVELRIHICKWLLKKKREVMRRIEIQ